MAWIHVIRKSHLVHMTIYSCIIYLLSVYLNLICMVSVAQLLTATLYIHHILKALYSNQCNWKICPTLSTSWTKLKPYLPSFISWSKSWSYIYETHWTFTVCYWDITSSASSRVCWCVHACLLSCDRSSLWANLRLTSTYLWQKLWSIHKIEIWLYWTW